MAWHPLERAVLADALTAAGPGAPTLCEGWRTEHLAAHVVLRERDLLTSAGIAIRPLTARTDRVTLATGDRAADPDGYARLVAEVRAGPPAWSPLAGQGTLRSCSSSSCTPRTFAAHPGHRPGCRTTRRPTPSRTCCGAAWCSPHR